MLIRNPGQCIATAPDLGQNLGGNDSNKNVITRPPSWPPTEHFAVALNGTTRTLLARLWHRLHARADVHDKGNNRNPGYDTESATTCTLLRVARPRQPRFDIHETNVSFSALIQVNTNQLVVANRLSAYQNVTNIGCGPSSCVCTKIAPTEQKSTRKVVS